MLQEQAAVMGIRVRDKVPVVTDTSLSFQLPKWQLLPYPLCTALPSHPKHDVAFTFPPTVLLSAGGASAALPLAGCHQLRVTQGGSQPASPATPLAASNPTGEIPATALGEGEAPVRLGRAGTAWKHRQAPKSLWRTQPAAVWNNKPVLVAPGSCCVQLEIPGCSSGRETLKLLHQLT